MRIIARDRGALKYNEEIAAEYLKYFRKMEETFGLENDIRVSTLGRCPEVLTMEDTDIDEEEIWAELKKTAGGCLRAVCTGQRAGRRGFESRSA